MVILLERMDESSTLTAGRAYFLSTSTAGNHSSVKTTEDGKIQKAVMIGLGTDRALVTQFIGGEVDQINAAQDATIQNKFVYTQADHGFTFGDAIFIRDTTGSSDTTDKFRRANALPEEGEFDPSDVVPLSRIPLLAVIPVYSVRSWAELSTSPQTHLI